MHGTNRILVHPSTKSSEEFAKLDARTPLERAVGEVSGGEREAASLESSAALLRDIAARIEALASDLRRVCYLNTSTDQRGEVVPTT